MAAAQASSLLRQLRQAILRHDGAGLTDGQLLRSFLNRRDESAFEALVRRHGPMVRGVCRRVLRNAEDADDAFQAVFLVLIRKAASLASREVVGDWLHGVAYRTALKARAAQARRRMKERQTSRREAIEEEDRSEWRTLLDQEVGRLPEKYRAPVVLCDLEGRTRKEAAHQLGWPEGTLSGRLARARAILARRLTRRGVTLSAGTLAMVLAQEAAAHLPISLVRFPFQAAEAVPANIVALTEGVVKAMFMAKLKTAAVLLSSALVLAVGVGAWRHVAAGPAEERSAEEPAVTGQSVDRPKILVAPHAGRRFQFDLDITEVRDGQRKLLASPRMSTVEGKQQWFATGKMVEVAAGGGKVEPVCMGPTIRLVARADERGKIGLDMTVSQPTRGTFGLGETIVEAKSARILRIVNLGDAVTVRLKTDEKNQTMLEVTATVSEVEDNPDQKSIQAAEKDLKIAEFYRRTGHPDSTRFYYELIRRRYPNTIYAERATERMAELKKQPDNRVARVGQIFIIGNTKTKQDVILKQVPLYPGQILLYPEIREAERKLSRLKIFKSAKITVSGNDDSVFKDIKIMVEEK